MEIIRIRIKIGLSFETWSGKKELWRSFRIIQREEEKISTITVIERKMVKSYES